MTVKSCQELKRRFRNNTSRKNNPPKQKIAKQHQLSPLYEISETKNGSLNQHRAAREKGFLNMLCRSIPFHRFGSHWNRSKALQCFLSKIIITQRLQSRTQLDGTISKSHPFTGGGGDVVVVGSRYWAGYISRTRPRTCTHLRSALTVTLWRLFAGSRNRRGEFRKSKNRQ